MCFTAAVNSTTLCENKSGTPFFEEEILEDGQEGKVTTNVIIISPEGDESETTISCIIVTNIATAEDSTWDIVSGGVGNKNVTLMFTSKIGKGFQYRLQIYGEQHEAFEANISAFAITLIIFSIIIVIIIIALLMLPCKKDKKKPQNLQSILDRLYSDGNRPVNELYI